MSPSSLRRFRAERLLRRDFEALRSCVLASVRSRLGAGSSGLDTSDLEACYAVAWQGLYSAMLEGKQIANPTGWLVIVTLRRAIDERRARHEAQRAAYGTLEVRGEEPDIAARMDDMRQLRQLFEGLRERLDRRECEAATLCYLHGLSRAEAARRMGVSDRRMRKLMEGDGCGRRGVSAKVGELLGVIRAEGWCAERGSLMRALALGVLDPAGERHRLALAHQRQCPACRRYVLSLRGLAAILPPLALPSTLGGAAGAGAGAGAGVGSGAGAGVGSGAGAGLGAGPPIAASIAGKLVAGIAAVGLAASGALIAVNEDAKSSGQPESRRSHDTGTGTAGVVAGASSSDLGAGRRSVATASLARLALAGDPTVAAASPSRATNGPLAGVRIWHGAGIEFGIEGARSPAPRRLPRPRSRRPAVAVGRARGADVPTPLSAPVPGAALSPANGAARPPERSSHASALGSGGSPPSRAGARPGGEFSFE